MGIIGNKIITKAKKKQQLEIIKDNLILNLDAGNTGSYPGNGTIWYDISEKGNTNLNLSNNVSYENGYLLFNNSQAYNDTTNFGLGTEDFSIETWSYRDKIYPAGAYYQTIFTLNMPGNGIGIRCSQPNNDNYYWVSNNFTTFTITDNLYTWKQFVLTKSGTSLIFYVNSALWSTANIPPNTSIANGSLRVGKSNHDGSEYWSGRISIVRIYKGKALTGAEVLQNFNAIKSRYGL